MPHAQGRWWVVPHPCPTKKAVLSLSGVGPASSISVCVCVCVLKVLFLSTRGVDEKGVSSWSECQERCRDARGAICEAEAECEAKAGGADRAPERPAPWRRRALKACCFQPACLCAYAGAFPKGRFSLTLSRRAAASGSEFEFRGPEAAWPACSRSALRPRKQFRPPAWPPRGRCLKPRLGAGSSTSLGSSDMLEEGSGKVPQMVEMELKVETPLGAVVVLPSPGKTRRRNTCAICSRAQAV